MKFKDCRRGGGDDLAVTVRAGECSRGDLEVTVRVKEIQSEKSVDHSQFEVWRY